jgi:hypothetical protein
MAKTLKVGEIVNIEGRPLRIPKRDADGDILWKTKCPVCDAPEPSTEPQLEPLDTLNAIRSLVFQMPPQLRKPEDPQNSFHLMTALRQSDGNNLTLEDSDYAFLHRLIEREIPLPEDKPDATPETLGSALWGINAWVVTQQLTPDGVDIPKAVEA